MGYAPTPDRARFWLVEITGSIAFCAVCYLLSAYLKEER